MAAVQHRTSRLLCEGPPPPRTTRCLPACRSTQVMAAVPDSAHAWLLDLPKEQSATRGAPPRTLPIGKSPLLSPQKGERTAHPQGEWGGVLNASRFQRNTNHSQRESFSIRVVCKCVSFSYKCYVRRTTQVLSSVQLWFRSSPRRMSIMEANERYEVILIHTGNDQ